MDTSFEAYEHQGIGRIPNTLSWYHSIARTFQIHLSGNEKFKEHRDMKCKLPWSYEGASPRQLDAFCRELLSQKGSTEPIVQSGGIYGVHPQFADMNSDLIVKELSEDPRFKALETDDFRRAHEFFRIIFGNEHLRNRNPLHFSVIDCCLISNVLNVPKQIFGFPYACYGTDGIESLSLLLFSYRQIRSYVSSPVVVYVSEGGDLDDELMGQITQRLQISAVGASVDTLKEMLEVHGDRCVAVLAVGVCSRTLNRMASDATAASVPLHAHVTDRQIRNLFGSHRTEPMHLKMPEAVESVSISDGMFTCGYSLYRNPKTRDVHMDVAIKWQTLYLSPNEGGSGSSRPLLVDLCIWLLGWRALRRVALYGVNDAAHSRRRRLEVIRFHPNSNIRSAWSHAARRSFRGILERAEDVVSKLSDSRRGNKSGGVSRTSLLKEIATFQTRFIGGRSRPLEAFVTAGGTRSINLAFEAVLRRNEPWAYGEDNPPVVITGNPHLAVERAQRRFGFDLIRVAERGVISIPKLRDAVRDERVVAIYSQTLSYTDGTSDPLEDVSVVLEEENRRRASRGIHSIVHINDCCLALSVVIRNENQRGESMRVLDFDAPHTPTIVTIDAHKHMGAEKGFSTVFGTSSTLSVLDTRVCVGSPPTNGDVVRTMANLLYVESLGGYRQVYTRLADAVAEAATSLERAGLRLVRPRERAYGSTVLCFEDPSGGMGRALNKRGFNTSTVYNLFDGAADEIGKTQGAFQLSVTPHQLRAAPNGQDMTALDVFVEEAKRTHRDFVASPFYRVIRATFPERSFLAHVAADNVPVYLFSLISGGGVARSLGKMLARRYCSCLLDEGAMFCVNDTEAVAISRFRTLCGAVQIVVFCLVCHFALAFEVPEIGYAVVAALLLRRWGVL